VIKKTRFLSISICKNLSSYSSIYWQEGRFPSVSIVCEKLYSCSSTVRKKPVPGPLSVRQKPNFASSFLSICISTVLTYVLYRKPGSCLCPPTVHLHRKLQSFPCTFTYSTHIFTYCVYWSYGPVGCLPTVYDICGRKPESSPCVYLQSTQSAGPVRFLIFCSISIFLLASLVAGRRPQCNSGAE
jgi:hypothetical protein